MQLMKRGFKMLLGVLMSFSLMVSDVSGYLVYAVENPDGVLSSDENDARNAVSDGDTLEIAEVSDGDAWGSGGQTEILVSVPSSEEYSVPAMDAVAENWYEDYEYTLDNSSKKIILTKSNGNLAQNMTTRVTVPATAVISETTYTTVLDNSGNVNAKQGLWYADKEIIISLTLEEGVEVSGNCSYLFAGLTKLTTLEISSLNTSDVSRMDNMFQNCSGLTSLNVGSFDTKNVRSMSGMFSGCEALEELDLRTFTTSSVTTMKQMFDGCKALKELDLGTFNTGAVEDMSCVFRNCQNMRYLEIGSFDTKNVTNMSYMFANCKSLMELNVSSFNTAKVTGLDEMFGSLSPYVTTLDLRSFNFGDLSNSYTSRLFGQSWACSEFINLYLPVSAMKQYDFGVLPNLAHIYYAGDEEQWELLGNTVPSTVEITYNYLDPEEPVKTPYMVMFDANGGTVEITEKTVTEGEKYGTLPEAAREGHTFLGWFTAADDGTEVKFYTAVTKETTHTLYAHWQKDGQDDPEPDNPDPVSVTEVTLNKTTLSLKVGESETLIATIVPADAADQKVTWTSSLPSVATVDETGKVTAVSTGKDAAGADAVNGTATITVTTEDGNKTAACEVTVTAKDSGETDPDNPKPDDPKPDDPKPDDPKPDDPKTQTAYTVTFYVDSVELYRESVPAGKTVQNLPDAPAGDGIFVGWYRDDNDALWDATSPVNRKLALEARFVRDTGEGKDSALDSRVIIEPEQDVYVVKGQKFELDASGVWTSDNSKVIAIRKK